MGRYMSNRKRIEEIVTIMELSDLVDMDVPATTTTKKRKISDTRSHNRVADTPASFAFPVANLVENYASSDEEAGSTTSCCSSNSKSLDLDGNGVEIADNRSSREKRSSSNERVEESCELELKKMPPHDDEDPSPRKIPSTKEIEEFFTRCEKKMLKLFRKKYNFDFEKEEPLEGRYKWVQT